MGVTQEKPKPEKMEGRGRSLYDNASTTAPARAIVWVSLFVTVNTGSARRIRLYTGAAGLLLLHASQ